MHRRRHAFSQEEVAFLIGAGSAATIARYELGRREPSLDTALALEALYGAPVAELFAGRFNTVEQSVVSRASELIANVRAAGISPAATAKLQALGELSRRTNLFAS
ncbi:MAG TPA: helix-turn-helix transcriptional regulator [Thermoanaerobaculia bacterium]|jgi:transcriptional regulator with XRE-family HTH domain|nr:helix-turn-helix transcriptional regulator [Thermoanaerobaculia bacterium]